MTGAGVTIVTATLPLVGALGGYFLAGLNEDNRDKRAAAREEIARRAAFAEKLEESRHLFQRDTLLALQDELQRMVRINARVIMADQRTLRDTGQVTQLPGTLSDEDLEVGIAVRRLTARALDDGLRAKVDEFIECCAEVGVGVPMRLTGEQPDRAIAELDRWMARLTAVYSDCHNYLGVLIRAELDRRYLAIN